MKYVSGAKEKVDKQSKKLPRYLLQPLQCINQANIYSSLSPFPVQFFKTYFIKICTYVFIQLIFTAGENHNIMLHYNLIRIFCKKLLLQDLILPLIFPVIFSKSILLERVTGNDWIGYYGHCKSYYRWESNWMSKYSNWFSINHHSCQS